MQGNVLEESRASAYARLRFDAKTNTTRAIFNAFDYLERTLKQLVIISGIPQALQVNAMDVHRVAVVAEQMGILSRREVDSVLELSGVADDLAWAPTKELSTETATAYVELCIRIIDSAYETAAHRLASAVPRKL